MPVGDWGRGGWVWRQGGGYGGLKGRGRWGLGLVRKEERDGKGRGGAMADSPRLGAPGRSPPRGWEKLILAARAG